MVHSAGAERITLICDNLNTHTEASFYQAFPPEEAWRIVQRLELIHTPKHDRWLNVVESELSVLTRQALGGRRDSLELVAAEARAWADDRNDRQTGVDWQFTTADARTKLQYPYPKIVA